MKNTERDRLLQEGIAAARAGHREQARDLLLQVIALDEEVEPAWLWLSSVVDDPGERQICLENVLALNPGNTAARKGLAWLREQGDVPESPTPPRPSLVAVEIDPYGCPYCGGSVSDAHARCDHCRRSVALRHRKKESGADVGWLVLFFLLLALATWLEGTMAAELVQMDRLPQWLSQTFVVFMVGPALFSPQGAGELADFAGVVQMVNYLLAGLCVLAAVGLALRSRPAYFASFLLIGFVVVVTGAGLLAQLIGWLPGLFRLVLAAAALKRLVDSSPSFEWETRHYNADLDQDLRTDMDYHNRGQQYYDQGMWAKAATHWKVASQLAPSQVRYRADLAKAYVRMGYPGPALLEADRALAGAPDDEELRAFRNSIASLEAAN
jgi:tetratricopeptide (TPR) repeat protein